MNQSPIWGQYTGAVSLTFDDGTDNQLRQAVPPLDAHGLRGTFYLHARDKLMQTRSAEWQAVASSGHEIGNHTLAHICSNNFTGSRGGLEDCTLDDIKHDILHAQERLLTIAPQQKNWTFAYPCHCQFVGRGENRQSYVPLIAKHFLAGRGLSEYGFGNQPGFFDLASAGGIRVDRMSGFEMIGLVEELTARGLWVILVFHDIDGGVLSVAADDYNMLLRYLKRRRQDIWTATVAEVALRIHAQTK